LKNLGKTPRLSLSKEYALKAQSQAKNVTAEARETSMQGSWHFREIQITYGQN